MNYPGKGHYMRHLAGLQTDKVRLFTCNQQLAEAQAAQRIGRLLHLNPDQTATTAHVVGHRE